MSTSKFKTFKTKIQQMTQSTQILHFSRLSLIIFLLLLGIAAGNFAINMIKNQSFMANLDVMTNLQILLMQVPKQAHATRELTLIGNGLVQLNDSVITGYNYTSKYQFYADSLAKASALFEGIQNHLQTSLKELI
jgi:hypothetical protein